MNARTFRVNWEWAEYAHGPGADDRQPLALAILAAPLTRDRSAILLTDPEHVAEVVSVAELYADNSSVQDDERLWWRAYPARLIERGRAWLAARKARP